MSDPLPTLAAVRFWVSKTRNISRFDNHGVEIGVKPVSRLTAIPVISRQPRLVASTFLRRAAKSKAVRPSGNTIA